MLQAGLQRIVSRFQHRFAVAVSGFADTLEQLIIAAALRQCQVAGIRAGGVTDDMGIILAGAGGHQPGFQGQFAGGADHVTELLAGGGAALGFAVVETNAPAAFPGDVAIELQVDGRVYSGAVEGGEAFPGLEFIAGDDVALVTAAAGGQGAIVHIE